MQPWEMDEGQGADDDPEPDDSDDEPPSKKKKSSKKIVRSSSLHTVDLPDPPNTIDRAKRRCPASQTWIHSSRSSRRSMSLAHALPIPAYAAFITSKLIGTSIWPKMFYCSGRTPFTRYSGYFSWMTHASTDTCS